MERRLQISPSILSADLGNLASEIELIESAGADSIHVDVMDGHFVPNITWGAPIVRAAKQATRLPLDVHLMIEHPDRFVSDFAEAGADVLGIHIEADRHAHRTLGRIRELGMKACITLNPQTGVECLEAILGEVDQVLVMSVNPGFAGQKFIPQVLTKIEQLCARRAKRGLDFDIQIDGGINPNTARSAVEAGADILVAGAALFGQPDRDLAMKNLRTAALGQHG